MGDARHNHIATDDDDDEMLKERHRERKGKRQEHMLCVTFTHNYLHCGDTEDRYT